MLVKMLFLEAMWTEGMVQYGGFYQNLFILCKKNKPFRITDDK